MIKGDLKCYHCGYISGTASGDQEQPLKEWHVRLASTCDPQRVWRAGRLHCCRCGGPLFMDETDFMHEERGEPPQAA